MVTAVDPDKKLNDPFGTAKGIFYLRTALSVLLICLCSKMFSQAKLEVTEAKKNFGFVTRGTIVKNEFEITNTGNQPLIISDVEVSCSCTTVDFSRQPILPGQKTIVTVIFNTTTVYGRQDRVVLLKSNDPKSPVKLRYKGTVSQK